MSSPTPAKSDTTVWQAPANQFCAVRIRGQGFIFISDSMRRLLRGRKRH